MKRTLFPKALALAGRISKSIKLPKCKTLLLGIALLGFAANGWTQGGTVVAWGDNRYGQTNVPPNLSNVVAVEAGEWHNLALKADGSLIAWGVNNIGQRDIPSDVTNVVAIGTGGYHNLAVMADRTVRVWGANEYGQSNVPAGLNNVVQVGGGWTHSVALKADGTVVAWGRNSEGQATIPFGLTNVVKIAPGEYHNLALKADGTVVAWGWNGFGQTTIPASLSNNVVAIAASGMHSLALTTDGTVTAWGWNGFGQIDVPAGLTDVVSIGAGAEHSLAIKSDGTAVAWGNNTAWKFNDPNCQIIGHPCEREYTGQSTVPAGLGNVIAITGGNFHSVALRVGGTPPPPPSRFTLTQNISPAGSGSINVAPASGDGKYDSNTVVTLTAVPAADKIFTGWSGAATGTDNPIQITMNGNKTVTATFASVSAPTFTLTANVDPSSGGTISADPPGPTYAANTVVTLTAVPATDNIFTGWSGAATGTDNQIQITMNGNKTVTATFAPVSATTFTLTANVTPSSAGVVDVSPYSASGSYPAGTVVTLTAQPNGTNVFAAWSGDATGLSNQVEVVMNANKTVTALFNNPGKFVFHHTDRRLAVWFLQDTERVAAAHFNNGQPLGSNWRLTGAGDLDNNGSKDLFFRGINGQLAFWMMDGNNRTSSVLWNTGQVVPAAWRLAGSDDFNSDGKADLLWHNKQTGVLNVWLMDGTTRTSAVKLANTIGAQWRVAATAKFDANNSPDIVFQGDDGRIAIWLMNGYERGSNVLLREGVSAGPGFVAVGATDIDDDGNIDIVFQSPDGIFKVWFMAGATFDREETLPATVGSGWKLRAVK